MNIQKLRLQRGWSQQQLADLCGLSSRTIQRIENGQTASVESLKSLASVFEIDFSSLTSEQIMESTKATNQDEQLALAKVRKIRRFYIHLVQYALVISVLAIINLATHPSKLWFIWPALGWGIGIFAHAAAIYNVIPFLGAEWERKQVEKELGRPL
jgi:transcriptional regulator with XRE-family HTH domain